MCIRDSSSHNPAEAQAAMAAIDQIPGASAYRNRASEQLVSPGSTFKLIDAVAMLESGDYTPDGTVDIPAAWTLPGTTTELPNYDGSPCNTVGRQTLTWALAQSCNTPFAMAAVELGQDRIREVAERFGFNDSFDYPLPVTGSVFPSDLDDATLAQSSIGQRDVQATALQMAMVAAGIANDGVVMEPQLIKAVRRSDLTTVQEFSPRERGRATTPEVAGQVSDMMVSAVEDGILGSVQSDTVRIAAKSGTAEVGDTGNVHSWITGFDASENPRAAVTIVVEDEPPGVGHQTVVSGMKAIMEAVVTE